jgi:hypothetical protein
MRILSIIIFWIAIILLVAWLGLPLIVEVTNLILLDTAFSDFYHKSKVFVVPIAFLLTLVKTLKKGSPLYIQARALFFTIGAAVLSILIFMVSLSDMCGDTVKKVLFINRQKPTTKIYLREYDCGAVGVGGLEIVRIDTVAIIFSRVEKVDTAQLDKNDWIRQ